MVLGLESRVQGFGPLIYLELLLATTGTATPRTISARPVISRDGATEAEERETTSGESIDVAARHTIVTSGVAMELPEPVARKMKTADATCERWNKLCLVEGRLDLGVRKGGGCGEIVPCFAPHKVPARQMR
jgi:hypothetical protein